MSEQEEKLDVDAAIAALNDALARQYRSALQYSLTSGSLFGFEFQSLGDRLTNASEIRRGGRDENLGR